MQLLSSLTPIELAGQLVSLVALVLCMLAFSSKRDDRLMKLLVSANIAFALQFALFGSWAASVLTLLVILRIVLARRYARNLKVMGFVLVASLLATALTWRGPVDLFPLAATFMGTVGMFMLRGIPMRLMLAGAGSAWMLSSLVIGSVGGTLAEAVVVGVNLITVARMMMDKKRASEHSQ
ncbi:YgjV family protein [Marinobacterium mangrovicola]|uniref:Inner membrane protein n=1 Tax=Marinobacterium mangrovicola TaxID=1476959 RepID=A0A4R1GR12_9GAMM|nr:YgjV family protein [Marinobacterium mangrovicola]TCK08599.1 inner membrane protein [Marinobacterium mangrovicola]